MSSLQFSLSCDTYKTNIYNGLSSLQQREEFVDMTLAADGHFVKVHQMIVSLASPYLKELILSAPCPHPVVFLDKISYPILRCILEYIYSGEVMVDKESLPELVAAGKALHIKGLQDMVLSQDTVIVANPSALVERLQQIKSQSISKGEKSGPNYKSLSTNEESFDENMCDPFAEDDHLRDDDSNINGLQSSETRSNENVVNVTFTQNNSAITNDLNPKTVQYTLSNQGSLQLILNRFVYYLRYCHKNSDPPVRLWRCVDYIKTRCPASVTTKDDIVVQRISAHKHGFHDKKIMKKLKAGTIFTAIKDAEIKGLEEKKK